MQHPLWLYDSSIGVLAQGVVHYPVKWVMHGLTEMCALFPPTTIWCALKYALDKPWHVWCITGTLSETQRVVMHHSPLVQVAGRFYLLLVVHYLLHDGAVTRSLWCITWSWRYYCTILIDLARGVTCDTAVTIWHSGHLPCDIGQTEIVTNILWHFKKKGNWSMKGIASDNLVYLNKPIEGLVACHGLWLVLVQNLCTNSSWTIFLNITTFNNNVWITTTCFWAVSTW